MDLELMIEKPAYDALDEGMRGLYAEKDGKYRLNVKGYEDPAEKTAKLAELESQLAAFKKAGKTPEEIDALKRICSLEQVVRLHEAKFEAIEDHIEDDVPIDTYTGKVAKKILLYMAGTGSMWLIERLPKIIALLQ